MTEPTESQPETGEYTPNAGPAEPTPSQQDPTAGDVDEVTGSNAQPDRDGSSTAQESEIESESEALNAPSSPGDDHDRSVSEPRRSAARGPSGGGVLSRVSLGSALLAVDALNERLEHVEEAGEREDPASRTPASVLVPQSEWGERFGETTGTAARHLTIGVMVDARSRAGRSVVFLTDVGNAAAKALDIIFAPITHSRLLRPVRKGFESAVERGETQVNYWMNLGRVEDIRSRSLAENALTQVVDDSMDDIVENERIQEFVQEMLAAQSIGIIDEAIEEIRERAVSSDIFFEQPFRRLFRREPRLSVPGPDFDRRLVRPAGKRNLLVDERSLLGYYAGFTSRLLAFALDVAIVIVFMAMTGWLFQTIGRLLGGAPALESLALTEEMVTVVSVIISSLNALTVVVAYAFIFWILTGQTPGMMLLGLRVVSHDGGHLSFWQSLRRLIGYVISVALFFLGFAWILIDDRREGWHDKLAGTYVVYSWDAHPDETFLTIRMRLGE